LFSRIIIKKKSEEIYYNSEIIFNILISKREVKNFQLIIGNSQPKALEQSIRVPDFKNEDTKYDLVHDYIGKLEQELNHEKMNFLRVFEEKEMSLRELELKDKERLGLKSTLESLNQSLRSLESTLKEKERETQELTHKFEESLIKNKEDIEAVFLEEKRKLEQQNLDMSNNLEITNRTIQELEAQLIVANRPEPRLSIPNEKEVSLAIEQLSLIILSKVI
jgi:hypothetical protein